MSLVSNMKGGREQIVRKMIKVVCVREREKEIIK